MGMSGGRPWAGVCVHGCCQPTAVHALLLPPAPTTPARDPPLPPPLPQTTFSSLSSAGWLSLVFILFGFLLVSPCSHAWWAWGNIWDTEVLS